MPPLRCCPLLIFHHCGCFSPVCVEPKSSMMSRTILPQTPTSGSPSRKGKPFRRESRSCVSCVTPLTSPKKSSLTSLAGRSWRITAAWLHTTAGEGGQQRRGTPSSGEVKTGTDSDRGLATAGRARVGNSSNNPSVRARVTRQIGNLAKQGNCFVRGGGKKMLWVRCACAGRCAGWERGIFTPRCLCCRLDETIEAINCGTLSQPAGSPEAKMTLSDGVLVNPRLLQPTPVVSVGQGVCSRVMTDFGRVELENRVFEHVCDASFLPCAREMLISHLSGGQRRLPVPCPSLPCSLVYLSFSLLPPGIWRNSGCVTFSALLMKPFLSDSNLYPPIPLESQWSWYMLSVWGFDHSQFGMSMAMNTLRTLLSSCECSETPAG